MASVLYFASSIQYFYLYILWPSPPPLLAIQLDVSRETLWWGWTGCPSSSSLATAWVDLVPSWSLC